MDSRQRTRQCTRERKSLKAPVQPQWQIGLPLSREVYDDIWHDTSPVQTWVERMIDQFPELFPEGIQNGFSLTGFLPASQKRPSVRLRQIRLIAPILCFLHGFLKVRDRCRKDHALHSRIWDV